MEKEEYYGTGRRKTAVARTRIIPGSGKIMINGKTVEDFFGLKSAHAVIKAPFILTNTVDDFDVIVRVDGGGTTGQSGAIRHGITRALIEYNPDFRKPLKKAGFVSRDSRIKERKKYGQKGARARFQFSKR